MLKHLIFIHKSELTDCHAGLYPQNLLLQQRGETFLYSGKDPTRFQKNLHTQLTLLVEGWFPRCTFDLEGVY